MNTFKLDHPQGSSASTPLELVCPVHHQKLLPRENEIICLEGQHKWPMEDGIPCFVDSKEYWGEPGITLEVARQIINEMETKSWHEVMRDHPSARVRESYQFISDMNRAKWHSQLGLTKESVVLDVGAGMGTISQALSEHCGRVYAIERVRERVDFMRCRFQQENCRNITIIRTDLNCLPFPERHFDLIVLNGVLEWLPFSRRNENPRRAQLFYLRVLRKLLKAGGKLYIGIENRTNYGFFIGAPDPHVAIKFVTIMPRFMAHGICKVKTGDLYRPYLYSSRGYRNLLLEAGYHDIQIYSALPSYNDPQTITGLQNHSVDFVDIVWPSHNPISLWVKKILVRMDLLKYMGYAYIIFAGE